MAKLDIAELVVDNYDYKEVISACNTMVKGVNAGLQNAVSKENLGLVGQQQANLLMVQAILDKLDTKLSGQKKIQVIQ